MEKKNFIKTGIFVILIILIAIWGIGYLRNKNFFNSGNVFYAEYNDIKGLTKSGVVYLNGFKVGDVSEIKFKDDNSGKIIVEFVVKNDILIPKSSIAEINSLDIMGTRGIRIILGEQNNEFLKSGDTLASKVEDDLSEQVNQQILPLKIKAEEMLSSFDSVLVALKGVFNRRTRQNIRQSFEHIQVTLRNLQSVSYSLDTILTGKQKRIQRIIDNAESITSNLAANNEQVTLILNNFSDISDSLAKADIAATLRKVDNAAIDLNLILGKIERGEGSLGLLINDDSLYNKLNEAATDMDELLKDIKENPDRYIHFSALKIERKKAKRKAAKSKKK